MNNLRATNELINQAKRNYLIVGNWKMNTNISEAEDLAEYLAQNFEEEYCETVICPPVVFIEQCYLTIVDYKWKNLLLGVQNICWEEKGAITGDISANMVKPWVDYAIIGHSERRQYFAETNLQINKKIKLAIQNKIIPVLCVGEKGLLSDNMVELGRDLKEGLAGLTIEEAAKLVIAYEPVWAIGSGNPANPTYANKTMRDIRNWLRDEYGFDISERIRIIYGGSVNANNALDYIKEEHVDGLLIGGVSLKGKDFLNIVEGASKEN